MKNIKNNFIDSIGNTPLIKLKAASEITGNIITVDGGNIEASLR